MLGLCEALAAPPYNHTLDRPEKVGHTARALAQGFTGKDQEAVKAWADLFGTFLDRYKLGKVEHESATSKVVHAIDMKAEIDKSHNVVVKFMSDSAQHSQELSTRAKQLDPKFTVAILTDSEKLEGFTEEVADKKWRALKLGNYPYGIVMEVGERNLKAVFLHEKPDIHSIRSMFKQLFECVDHLHSKGIMHGDLKALNVVRFASDNHLRLIDFDAAASIPGEDLPAEGVNEWAGAKFSSGTLPPEMLLGQRVHSSLVTMPRPGTKSTRRHLHRTRGTTAIASRCSNGE